MTDEPTDVKQKNINYIKNLYAFVLFTQQQFKESLEIFAALGTGMTNCYIAPILTFAISNVRTLLAIQPES